MNGSEGGAGFYFRAGREVKAIREDFPPGKEERKKALSSISTMRSVDFVYHSAVNKRSYHRSIVILKLYNNGNSNLSRHLYIWFTCKFYWVCLIYCLWATLSTIKRSIRRTRGLIEIMKNHFIF
ncbi:hypothetical protein V6N12_001931 [Hibiscus sabdariffa]|uniref:Uncharacterized protein n=1 Tax=Hibiscus sabdariffa TaxID=183260 RepID=A0ABR2BSH1_9ROSI